MSLFTFKGYWNAATNTPTLVGGVGTTYDTYIVNTSGTLNLGAGSVMYLPGQSVVYMSGAWIQMPISYTGELLSTGGGGGSGVTAITVSSPLTGGVITSTGTIGIPLATSIADGYLAATDWVIFNAKQPAGNYITALTGEATASGPGSVAITLTNSAVIAKVITGYVSGAGTVSATDSILQAIQKLNGNIGALTTGVSSVYGRTGVVIAVSGDYTTALVTEVTNLYFTNARAIAAVLTAYVSGAGIITASDSILTAIQKLNGNIGALVTGVSSVFGRTGTVSAAAADYSGIAMTGITSLNGLIITANTGVITTGIWNATKVGEIYGGTNQTTYITGDILYASAANVLSKLGIGSSGQVLTIAAGIPSWATPTTGTVASVSGTANRITSTGGATPVIDISATFEALLGKVATGLGQFASTTSAQLATVISDETGSGALVFATSPTLVTPALGTPSSGTLTNCTFPILNQDTTGKSAKTDALNSATTVVNVASATAPSTGQVLTATDSTHATWQTPTTGTVTSVSGTASRITSTGGATPVIDISATFEALLGKVATGLNQFAATTSAQLAGVISDETGSGALVFATSPTLVTPALGTPSALVGTNITGTAAGLTAGNVTTNANLTGPITSVGNATSIAAQTGTGTTFVVQTSPTLTTPNIGVATATSVNKVTITAPVTSATLTIVDGGSLITAGAFPITLTASASTGVTLPTSGTLYGTATGSITSAQLLASLSDETGTGAAVFATSPTLVTPVLGTPTSGTLTNCTGLPIAGLVASTSTAIGVGSIELGAASDTTIARVSAGVISVEGSTVGMLPTAQTWTAQNKFNNIVDVNNAITASGNAATVPVTYRLSTVTNNSAATLTITMTTTSAVDGQLTMVRILDFSAVAQTITWVNTENSNTTAPVTSNGSTTLPLTVGFQYNSGTSKWRCIAST